jgi:hypothetical protein
MDQNRSQIGIAALADAEQSRFSATQGRSSEASD